MSICIEVGFTVVTLHFLNMVLQADILEEVILEVEASLEASKTLPNR